MTQQYEAHLFGFGGAIAETIFYSVCASHAKDHARELANSGTYGHNWDIDPDPDFLQCVRYKKIDGKRWKTIYPSRHPLNKKR